MPQFINPSSKELYLNGPDGRLVTLAPGQRVELHDYFMIYVGQGVLQRCDRQPIIKQRQIVNHGIHSGIKIQEAARREKIKNSPQQPKQRPLIKPPLPTPRVATPFKPPPQHPSAHRRPQTISPQVSHPRRQTVGRRIVTDATAVLHHTLTQGHYPISNGIGVGILSYNRKASLERLINSITKHTDLRATTVFVSDDGSTDPATRNYLDLLASRSDLVVLRNKTRLGIAGNSNRLLRCLARFDHTLLLNDDVEIRAPGWDKFYRDTCTATGMHHLIYRQVGVYAATAGEPITVGGKKLAVVHEKPQGAVLAMTAACLKSVGFMDERYGYYGMEHVEWSTRPGELQLQPTGFFDCPGADAYFRLHSEPCTVEGRGELLRAAKQRFYDRRRGYHGPSEASAVDAITCIVPFRNLGRAECVRTVLANLRAQRFPVINLIAVEQDVHPTLQQDFLGPVQLLHAPHGNPLFNKAVALNVGVSQARGPLVLHDADTMAHGNYVAAVNSVLRDYDACHLGARVIYADERSTMAITTQGAVNEDVDCDRVVGYFEGGSLGCTVDAFWNAGGFNEDFRGYGNEDTDFYYRISGTSKWYGQRSHDFLHLWHTRTPGWQQHHEVNKRLEEKLRGLPFDEYVMIQKQRVSRYTR